MTLPLKVQVWVYRFAAPANAQEGRQVLEVLLLRLRPERGGYWQPVTGGVDEGESLDVAARREASEETGLPFASAPVALDYSFRFRSPRYSGECEEHVFAIAAPAAELETPVFLDPHEHVESRWVFAQDALALLKHSSNVEGLQRLLGRLTAG